MRTSRAIRAGAWALIAAGAAAPVLRRRVRMPPAAVMLSSALAPVCANVVLPPGRRRQVAVCALNMWAYLAAYELPHDDPDGLEARVRVDYPIVADRVLGLGVPPTVRLQHAFSRPGQINRFERLLVWCHWVWFMVPHASVAYLFLRRPERFPAAAARMYATFDVGAIFYWAIPTAPPWYAARQGRLGRGGEPGSGGDSSGGGDPGGGGAPGGGGELPVRRMMIEYGEEFWGGRWSDLYDVLGGNPLAAMPSLHFATSLMGAHLLTEAGPVAGAVGFTYTALLGLALVYLGEHYAADLLGGAVLAEGVRWTAPRAAAPSRGWLLALNRLEALASGH